MRNEDRRICMVLKDSGGFERIPMIDIKKGMKFRLYEPDMVEVEPEKVFEACEDAYLVDNQLVDGILQNEVACVNCEL